MTLKISTATETVQPVSCIPY